MSPAGLNRFIERGGKVEHEDNVKRTELFEVGRGAVPHHLANIRTSGGCHVIRFTRNTNEMATRGTRRLKLPYALEIQQHFASQLTRVGVPTPTPLFRERPV